MTSCVSSSSWLRAAALLVPLLLTFTPTSRAESPHTFRQHYEAALRLYDGGQFEGAIKEFQAAYALKQLPRLLLNIGQAHRKLGHAKDALGFYEFYLRVEPDPKPEIKAELTTYISQTRALLDAAERMQAQQPPTEPAPVTEPPPPPPPATAAPPVAASAPQPVPVLTPAPLTAPIAVTAVPAGPRAPEGATARPIYKKWWFWTIIGVGVAAAATGIALGVRASASSDPTNIEIRNVF